MNQSLFNTLLGLFTPSTMPASASAGATAWANLLGSNSANALNVKDFGALGDGVTDDSTALQSALSAVPVGGGIVYFPPGTYILNANWLRIMQSGTTIQGAGKNLSILKSTRAYPGESPANGLHGLINSFGLSQITVQDMGFVGTVLMPATSWLDNVTGFSPALLQGSVVERGVFITTISAPNGSTNVSINDILITRCKASNCRGENFYTEHGATTTCNRVEMFFNESYNGASNSYNVNAGPSAVPAYVRIVGNYEENTNGGIQVGGQVNIVAGNRKKNGIASGAGWILLAAVYSDVYDNIVEEGNSINGAPVPFISIYSFINGWNLSADIHDNYIVNNLQSNSANQLGAIDIRCTGGPVRVSRNTIIGNGEAVGTAAIGLHWNSAGVGGIDANTEVLIDNNTVLAGASGFQTVGVKLDASIAGQTNKIRIRDNNFLVTTPISYNGAVPLVDDSNESLTVPNLSITAGAITVPGAGSPSEQFGASSAAGGASSLAVGNSASASGTQSTAVGTGAVASSTNAVAVGRLASATTGTGNVAVGQFSAATGSSGSTALGNNTVASSPSATAVGDAASASNNFAIAIGESANASGNGSIAIGHSAAAPNNSTVAVGNGSSANNTSVAVGQNTVATGSSAVAVGTSASTGANNGSVAIGNAATATGTQNAIAIGPSASAAGTQSVAIGSSAGATATNGVAVGISASAGNSAVSVGPNATSGNNAAIAVGSSSSATGSNGVAIGNGATDGGWNYCLAIGQGATCVAANTGEIGTETNKISLNIHGDIAITASSSPTSAGTAGRLGEITWDGTNLYLCTVAGGAGSATWKKVALAAA